MAVLNYVAKDGPALLLFLLQPPRHVLAQLVYVILGIEPRTL